MGTKWPLVVCLMAILFHRWEIRAAFSREPGLSMVIQSVKNPPRIDGRLDDAAWKRAARVDLAWTIRGEKVYEMVQGQALMAYDNAHLYVAFLNRVADDRMLDPDAPAQDQDLVSMDDRVEFVIAPENIGKGSHFRVSISAGSTTFSNWRAPDALSARVRDGEILAELIPIALAYSKDVEWKPQSLQTATHIDEQSWTAEIKIAFEDLLQSGPPVGQTWGGNFVRYDVGPGSLPTTWTRTGGNMYNPEKLGELIFLK
jgi:hypothetical protein